MPTLLKPVPMKFPNGIHHFADPTMTPQGYLQDARNVRFYGGAVWKRPGFANAGPVLPGTIQRIVEYVDLVGNYHWLAIGTQNIWSNDGGDDTWTPRAPYGLSGRTDMIPSFTEYQAYAVVANGVDHLLYWDGKAATFSIVNPFDGSAPGAPVTARYVLGFQDHLLAAYPTLDRDYPYRIMWTDFHSLTNWASGDAAIVDLLNYGDPIAGLNTIGEFGVVGRRYSIWLILPAPSPGFYQFTKRQDGAGVVAPGSFTNEEINEVGIVYLSDSDLFVFNGVSSTGVGTPMRNVIAMDALNFAALGTAVAAQNLAFAEYWLCYPGTKGNTYNDSILIWNWKDNTFTVDSVPATGVGRRQHVTRLRWSDMHFRWNPDAAAAGVRWNTNAGLQAPAIAIAQGVPGGSQIMQSDITPADNGAAFPSWIQTQLSDLGVPGRKRVERIQLSMDVLGDQPISVYLVASESSDFDIAQRWGPYTINTMQDREFWVDTDDVPAAKYFGVYVVHDLVEPWTLRDITLWARPRGEMG